LARAVQRSRLVGPIRMDARRHWRHVVVVLALVGAAAVVIVGPRLPQDPAYHQLADRRPLLGIPNCLNVLSNLPFALVALLGLAALFRVGRNPVPDHWKRWPYAVLFIGTGLTAVGSAYYHLAPDNDRLLWDRLPMTVGFVGLLTATVSERINPRLARRLVGPLLVLGLGSVVWWHWTEMRGQGDLRAYALLQYGSLSAVLLLLLLYPARYAGTAYVLAALGMYALAKGLEEADAAIFELGGIVSGHSLKHVAAAAAVAYLVATLRGSVSREGPVNGRSVAGSCNRAARLRPPG
jgi:hypothetical protein